MKTLLLLSMLFIASISLAQEKLPQTEEEFKREILELRSDVDQIQENLLLSHKRFKTGIAGAALGYTVTIVGGLMLGRENDNLGKALLYTGGAIGLTGTIMLVDAYKYVGRAGKDKREP